MNSGAVAIESEGRFSVGGTTHSDGQALVLIRRERAGCEAWT